MRERVRVLWFCVKEWANRPKSLLPIAGCEICETVVLLQFRVQASLNGRASNILLYFPNKKKFLFVTAVATERFNQF